MLTQTAKNERARLQNQFRQWFSYGLLRGAFDKAASRCLFLVDFRVRKCDEIKSGKERKTFWQFTTTTNCSTKLHKKASFGAKKQSPIFRVKAHKNWWSRLRANWWGRLRVSKRPWKLRHKLELFRALLDCLLTQLWQIFWISEEKKRGEIYRHDILSP